MITSQTPMPPSLFLYAKSLLLCGESLACTYHQVPLQLRLNVN